MKNLLGLHVGLTLMLVSMKPWVWIAWGLVTALMMGLILYRWLRL